MGVVIDNEDFILSCVDACNVAYWLALAAFCLCELWDNSFTLLIDCRPRYLTRSELMDLKKEAIRLYYQLLRAQQLSFKGDAAIIEGI